MDVIEAWYGHAEYYNGLETYIVRWPRIWIPVRALSDITYVGLIDGNPAVVEAHGSIVTIFDESTGVKYGVYGHDPSIRENAEAMIAIARSLLPEQDQPRALPYNRLDETGQATTPGSYAFLDAAGDVVTTYEGLRDRTTTGLRIHTSDADGASQVGVYGGVAVGDVVEWRKSEDCWVRYEVMEVKPDPVGTAPRKEFAIKWRAYAFTGCAGTVATGTAVGVTVDPPVNFLATPITAPVRYGPYQLIPSRWHGALEEAIKVARPSSGASGASETSEDSREPAWASGAPAVAHLHPLWNEPALPTGWTLNGFSAEDWYIEARYSDEHGYWAATTWIARQDWRPRDVRVGDVGVQDYVEDVRTIDGHPAYVQSYARGSAVYIFNEATGIEYFANLAASPDDPRGRGIDDAIALARSLYQ